MHRHRLTVAGVLCLLAAPIAASYTNFEVSQVHPIERVSTAAGPRLLVVNTPEAALEVFAVQGDGSLIHERTIPVGLEPVSVVARSGSEAWVVNQLSDSVSVVNLDSGRVVRTLPVGDEPSDVAFAGGKAFIAVAGADVVKAFDLANLDAAPAVVSIFSRKPRALDVSVDGTRVYVVPLFSGNQTTIVNAHAIWGTGFGLSYTRLSALGLTDTVTCSGPVPFYPTLPAGIERNPLLPNPPGSVDDYTPQLGLIVRWNESASQWQDEAGTNWNPCVRQRLPDQDLFAIDAASLAVTAVAHLGTTLFDVSVNPATGKIYVPATDARNFVRFEHPLGLRGHFVDNLLSIVDPAQGNAVTRIELNAHIDRASTPPGNLAERRASISQPGMLVWNAAGTAGYLTAIGSGKVFRVSASCTNGACIFGPDRALPAAVDVGEGPTGVALDETRDRLYVLNRFANSVALVQASTLTKLGELALHDPSGATVRAGRHLLYDAVATSAHGDGSCASCHVSGDRDDLAWELGNPEGDYVYYTGQGDNVRFIQPDRRLQRPCEELYPSDPFACASRDGFDPQKGPMITRSLRGLLEPLHARGDRATMNDFNQTFVELLGAQDVGPIQGKPAGVGAAEMEYLRQFALGISFPPNPYRPVDNSLPYEVVPVPGTTFSGSPYDGLQVYLYTEALSGHACRACHLAEFGSARGRLGGVTPTTPTSLDATGLVSSALVQLNHSDFEVPDLRNTHERMVMRTPGSPPLARSGFGLGHDGGVPDVGTFFSNNVFVFTAQEVRDVSAFVAYRWPADPKPAVGRHLTLPAGTPPTGTAAEESLLTDLLLLGNLQDAGRHCELVASTSLAGEPRRFRLSGGVWWSDRVAEPTRTTTELRETANGPVSFLCVPIGSGLRLGGDRDEDVVLDGDDCNAADPGAWSPASEVTGLAVVQGTNTALSWSPPATSPGPGLRYEVLGGDLSTLRASGLGAATTCLAAGLGTPAFTDLAPGPPPGEGRFYLVRGENGCGTGSSGIGREVLDGLDCPAP